MCARFLRSWPCALVIWLARRACAPGTSRAPATWRGRGASARERRLLLDASRPWLQRGDGVWRQLNLLPGQSCMRRRAALQLSVYKRDLYVKALRPGVSSQPLGVSSGGSLPPKAHAGEPAAPEINVTAAKREALATTVAALDCTTKCTTQRRPAARFEIAGAG